MKEEYTKEKEAQEKKREHNNLYHILRENQENHPMSADRCEQIRKALHEKMSEKTGRKVTVKVKGHRF